MLAKDPYLYASEGFPLAQTKRFAKFGVYTDYRAGPVPTFTHTRCSSVLLTDVTQTSLVAAHNSRHRKGEHDTAAEHAATGDRIRS